MKIHIHIGSDKAGSTAIQSTLSQNRKALLEHGVCYPQLKGKHINHEILAKEVQCGEKGPGWQELNSLLSKKPAHIILSSEAFCMLNQAEIFRFHGWLNHKNTQILAYIRSADQYLESGVLQRLKSAQSYNSFKKQYRLAIYTPALLDRSVFSAALKARFLTKWNAVFPSSVVTRPYESSQWNEQSIIKDLLSNFDLPKEVRELPLLTNRKNITPSMAGIYALSILSRNQLPGLRHSLSDSLESISGGQKSGPILSRNKRAITRYLSKLYNHLTLRTLAPVISNPPIAYCEKQPGMTSIVNDAENIIAQFLSKVNNKNKKLKAQINK
ncbi:hypothetical protein ACJJIQ_05340 [Microbulbifer sp. ANSA003]|uniref:hypothetical protein n=1 Tax=Microbulbifer sp. ANSA003 TaxID=3243360 RepID=UPI0040434D2E